MAVTWIIETMYYEIRTHGAVTGRVRVCNRIGRTDVPGVWLVRGSVRPELGDEYESRKTVVGVTEYTERRRRMGNYELAVHSPAIFGRL